VELLNEEIKSFQSKKYRMWKIMKEPWWSNWKELAVSDFSDWNRMSEDGRNAMVKMCNNRKM